ncbi:MAG: S-layer homology domain-containing protein [Thermomicrobiales bacterium]
MIGKRARVGLTLAIILNLVFAALVFVPAVGAATVAVTPANLGSWTIQDATCGGSNTGIYDFIAGPGTPPLGIGSARFRIGTDGDSYGGFRSTDLDGVRLDDLDTLSYSTYVSANVDGQAPYMTLSIDADGEGEFTPGANGSNDTTLFFEPVYQNGTYGGDPVPNQGNVTLNTWQTWDAFHGGWWDNNGAGGPPLITLATFLAANPDAEIISPGNPAGGLAVRAGCGGAAWANFVGNLDNLSTGRSLDNQPNERVDTTYNFDSIPQCTTTCYVNVATGDDFTKGGTSPADAKKTIQAAVDTVSSGGTVVVAAGTYPEHVVIGKPLTLQGPNAGVNPNLSSRNAEARVVPPANNYNGNSVSSAVIVLNADGITLDGLLIDGDNTAVGGGVAMNGADVNAFYGIVNNFADGTFAILAYAEETTIRNSIIRNFSEGVDLFATGSTSSGTAITNNRFDNMASRDDSSRGIVIGDNFYAAITGNVMTRVYNGVQTNNYNLAGSPATISGNQISSYRAGILHNLHYQDASTFTIANNVLTTADYTAWSAPGAVTNANRNYGILIWSIQSAVGVDISDNIASGNFVGIGAWNVPTTNTLTVSGGTLSGNQYGVQLYSCDERYGAGAAGTLKVRNVTVTNSTVAGLAVLDNPQANVGCIITNPQLLDAREVYVSGSSQAGILADGAQASLTVTRSSIQANTTGIAISNGAQAAPGGLHFNVILGNGTGLNATGATGSVNAENNWWGCNAGPGAPGCDTIAASADANPWLTLRLTRVPGGATAAGGTVFAVTADLIINSDGQDTSGIDTVLDGTPISFAVTSGGGSITPTTTGTTAGVANATFTASNACGPATIAATSDDQTVSSTVTIVAPCAVQVTLTLTTSGGGGSSVEVTPPGGSYTSTTQVYDVDTVVTLKPDVVSGYTFAGWMVDGVFSGWAPTLTITMNDDREVEAVFSSTRTFSDVGPLRGDYEAITELASRGYILGFGDGTYGPDKGVQRSEMAALIARATPKSVADDAPNLLTPPDCAVADTWACEVWNDVPLSDIGDLNPGLQRSIRTLAHYRVAVGYSGATCTAGGKAYPCYGPSDPVTFAQTISFITRAMIAKGYWIAHPEQPQLYAGVPAVHDTDVRTFIYYTGGVPALLPGKGWNDGATRGWFAESLWAALNSYWGTDGLLPDGRPAGGYQP